jgi:hypothetical protein
VRCCLAPLLAGSVTVGSIACGLTADFSGLQGGDAGAARVCDGGCDGEMGDGGASQNDAPSSGLEDGSDDSATDDAGCPTRVNSCPIQVTTDTFDTSYDGYITYVNAGMGSEVNPIVEFSVPSGVVLFTVGCSGSQGFQDQGVPGSITALSCSQSGTTIIYAFTGTLQPGDQIAIYYTTNLASEAVATCIAVAATSCP